MYYFLFVFTYILLIDFWEYFGFVDLFLQRLLSFTPSCGVPSSPMLCKPSIVPFPLSLCILPFISSYIPACSYQDPRSCQFLSLFNIFLTFESHIVYKIAFTYVTIFITYYSIVIQYREQLFHTHYYINYTAIYSQLRRSILLDLSQDM